VNQKQNFRDEFVKIIDIYFCCKSLSLELVFARNLKCPRRETEDSVPPVDKRLSRASKRNSLETVVDPAAGVTRRSPRSSPPSLVSDGNILNVSHHSSHGEDVSSVDTDEDDLQEEE